MKRQNFCKRHMELDMKMEEGKVNNKAKYIILKIYMGLVVA